MQGVLVYVAIIATFDLWWQQRNVKFEKILTEMFQLSKWAYGDDALGRTQFYEWFTRFKSERQSMKDDPPTLTHDTLVRTNHRMTVKELAEEIGIAIGLRHDILTEKLRCMELKQRLFLV